MRSEKFRQRHELFRLALQLRAQPLCFYPVIISVKASRLLLLLPKHLSNALRIVDIEMQHLMFPGATAVKTNSSLTLDGRMNVSDDCRGFLINN